MTSGTTRSGSPPAVDTILVVDHESLARMLISDYLRQCGYKVVEAVNADEAMKSAPIPRPYASLHFRDRYRLPQAAYGKSKEKPR